MKWPSQRVRDTFLQYFVKHGTFPHTIVPSSSIVPRNDPSLAFVNAGMNQFKDVILGYGRPAHPRVTNSQKCLRINDLGLVGTDTYHHTFFEMLGNWSFSNYFKKDTCEMAWDLLTSKYALDPSRLFVTYYAGSPTVPPDKETKQIWESIGVKPERILAYTSENFWKMGPIGPCGPSTEIHYDHRGPNLPPSDEVNGDSGLVVEIWNLVFMQYNLNGNGELERLPLSHVVDTGAGLERLSAVLNGMVSNYDTDLFAPIFEQVKKITGGVGYTGLFTGEGERDRCYRIFADHMRAVTVALADGILPQTNQKIRKLIQRTLAVSDQQFSTSTLSTSDRLKFFVETGVNPVTSSLSKSFPEILKMNSEIEKILESEINRYTEFAVKSENIKSHAGLPPLLLMNFPALSRIPKEELNRCREKGQIDGVTAHKWYESCGVTADAMEDLCSTWGLQFDATGMEVEMKRTKKFFRDEVAAQMIDNEDKIFVRKLESLMGLYDPKDSGGICNPTMNVVRESPGVFIEWIFDGNGDPVEEICSSNDSHWIILNRTPFVPGSEDFETDKGTLTLENGTILQVEQVRRLPSGWILHLVKNVPELGLNRKTGIREFQICNDVRFGREMSVKAVAHIQWWLKKKFGVVRFDNERALYKQCSMTVTLLDGDLNLEIVHQLQNDLNEFGVPAVLTKKSNPGKKFGVSELVFATGLCAEQAMRYGQEVLDCVLEIGELCKEGSGETKGKDVLRVMVDRVGECVKREDLMLPWEVYQEADKVLSVADKILWKSQEQVELTRMCQEIEVDSESDFVVKLFESDHEFNSLKKLTRVADQKNKPVLILIKSSDDVVYGRCSVPKGMSASTGLYAEEWMKCVCGELGKGVVAAPRGQDGKFQVNLKRTRVYDCGDRLGVAMESARKFASERLGKKFIECGGGSETVRMK